MPLIFSGDETTDIGEESASPVSDAYTAVISHFNGTVSWVQIDVDAAAEDLDHVITPRSGSASRWPGNST